MLTGRQHLRGDVSIGAKGLSEMMGWHRTRSCAILPRETRTFRPMIYLKGTRRELELSSRSYHCLRTVDKRSRTTGLTDREGILPFLMRQEFVGP